MQGTMYKVGNSRLRNGRCDVIRSSSGKHRSHMKTLTYLAYTEESWTNDNSYISKWYDLLGGLCLGKYGGSSENSYDQSHYSANFSGEFLPVGSKINDMNHRERKARLMERRGRGNIEAVGMTGEQYDGGADDDGKKRGL